MIATQRNLLGGLGQEAGLHELGPEFPLTLQVGRGHP